MDENGHEKRIDLNDESGLTRREVLRRGAIVGGTLLWVAPAIQSMAPKAFATDGENPGSARCAVCYCFNGRDIDKTTRDKGFDGTFGDPGLKSESDCHDFCFHTGDYLGGGGAPGLAYTGGSKFCSAAKPGGTCDTNTQIEPNTPAQPHNGAYCT